MEIKNKNLEWFYKINALNTEEKTLEDIPEEERDLFIEQFGELVYNWEGIYAALFNEGPYDDRIKVPTCPIPKGIKEFFEVDENGSPTEKYDWDYAINILEDIAETDIHHMWQTDKTDELSAVMCAMPANVGIILGEIDNPRELYNNPCVWDLNCPKELRDNKDIIYHFFKLADTRIDIYNCWEFMSDKLKHDRGFLLTLIGLCEESSVDTSTIMAEMDPEIFKNDDEFIQRMIDCWGEEVFAWHWGEFKKLWDEKKDQISYEKLEEMLSDCELYGMDEEDPEYVTALYEEKKKRNDLAIMIKMRRAVGKTVGTTQEVEKEIHGLLENEFEGDEYDD